MSNTHLPVVRTEAERDASAEDRRASFREEALAAWTAFEATGLHVPGDQADAWLARLEAGQDVEPPLAVTARSETTAEAIAELEAGKGVRFGSIDDLMADLRR